MFNLDPDYVPGLKVGLHSLQIIFSFVAWCLQIIVFRSKEATVNGKNGWNFAVCFLSIPAWIYLIGTPRWERTRKFAHPYAMFAVDVVFTILWISAFATQASYNASGLCGKGCNYSKGVVGLGVLVFLLFVGSSLVSAFTIHYYNFHNTLPGYDNQKLRGGENIDPDKAAFSMAPHDEEAYERVNMDDHDVSGSNYGGGYNSGSYNSTTRYGDANPYSADDDDPIRYGSVPPRINTMFDSETEYHGGAPPSMPYATPPTDPFGDGPSTSYANPPSDPYKDGPAHFPSANYDRGH